MRAEGSAWGFTQAMDGDEKLGPESWRSKSLDIGTFESWLMRLANLAG